MKSATSHLACSWTLPRLIIKSHQNKKWMWPWARGAPQNLGLPFNISATAEASNIKFGMQLGLAMARYKKHNQSKTWAWPWAREAPKYLGFLFNMSATAALSSALAELLVQKHLYTCSKFSLATNLGFILYFVCVFTLYRALIYFIMYVFCCLNSV